MKEVHKFGGTSVDHLDQVVRVILSRKEYNPHVCVSAFSGVTDLLLTLIKKAEKEQNISQKDFEDLKDFHLKKIVNGIQDKETKNFVTEKFLNFFNERKSPLKLALKNIYENGFNTLDHDRIIGFGEQSSAFTLATLLSFELKSEKLSAKFIDLGKIVTNGYKQANTIFQEALRENIAIELIDKKEDHEIAIITGFFGEVPGGILYAIDRGYTDFTGALTASIIQAARLIIFKEVDGVCSTDPRIVQNGCLLLKELSYTEVLKMASAGMKAVNTEAIKPAMKANIPIEVRNTMTPEKEGTEIIASRDKQTDRKIQNIAIKKDVCVIRFGGYNDSMEENLELKLIQLLEKHRTKKFFSTTDYAGTSVVLPYDKQKIEFLIDDLKIFGHVKVNKDCAIVAIIGEEMAGVPGILAAASSAIFETGTSIEMVAQGASEIGIDFVVKESQVNEVVERLHRAFFK